VASSSAGAAIVIENNFTGTGPLKITLEQEGIKDVVDCTGSTFKGTVSNPPDAKAKLSSWTMTGCTASSGGESFGSATVTVLYSLPAVEALSTNSVKVGPLTVRAEYKVHGSTCKPEVIMGSYNYSYTNGSSTNQLSAKVPHIFTIPGSVPPECLSGGLGYFEPSFSFTNPQFEVISAGQFLLRNSNSAGSPDLSFLYGLSSDIPISGDWDNDGDTTIGVYRPGTRRFYLRNSNSAGAPNLEVEYGLLPATPVIGDWDGNGTETIGLYSSIEANPYVWALNNANDSSGADYYFTWGTKGDIPIVGDWDNDGDTTVGLYRPSNRTFYLRNTNSAGPADQEVVYGLLPATPVIGDWDGDEKGTETIGLYSSIEANPYVWALNNANDSSGADYYFTWGTKGDIPIVGNWDGDADTTVGLFRP
jgi:hypothetical protein